MRRHKYVSVLMVLAPLLLGCTEAPSQPPVVPSTVALIAEAVPATTPDYSRTSLIPLDGTATTSTIAFAKGAVNISGKVTGPDGPVADATVRVERIVGQQMALTTITSGADGRWKLPKITGGIIRVQAFKVPDLAMPASQVTFASGDTKVDLTVQKYDGTTVRWALAPSQPMAGRQLNLVVQVAVKRVDADGYVRTVALAGIGVNVVALAALQPVSTTDAKITDEKGRVSFRLMCTTEGDSSLRIDLATGEVSTIVPNRCLLPPTTPPTTLDPALTVPVTVTIPAQNTVVADPGAVPIDPQATQPPPPAP